MEKLKRNAMNEGVAAARSPSCIWVRISIQVTVIHQLTGFISMKTDYTRCQKKILLNFLAINKIKKFETFLNM